MLSVSQDCAYGSLCRGGASVAKMGDWEIYKKNRKKGRESALSGVDHLPGTVQGESSGIQGPVAALVRSLKGVLE